MRRRWFHVVDGFYPDADEIRAVALRMEYREPIGVAGWRSPAFLPRGIKPRIESAFGLSIENWQIRAGPACGGNGMFFLSCSTGPRADPVAVHFDEPLDYKTLVVYLTPNPPRDSGLSFWQHRATGLAAAPTRADALRLRSSVTALREQLEADAWNPRRWIEIDRIQNAYNRAVAFRAGMLHSATRHFGATVPKARLYHSFHFVDSGSRSASRQNSSARRVPVRR